MTHQQKLEAIRKACVAANPSITIEQTALERVSEICFELTLGEEDGLSTMPDTNRPIRLADVLLALNQKSETHWYWSVNTTGAWFDGRQSVTHILCEWDLRNDDLSKQSEETVDFIHGLLEGV